jgi:hypothetical protein
MTESSNEKIVSRVQALLAKAESTTFPEEAEALVAKAQELMARYAIDEAVSSQRRGAGSHPKLRRITIEPPYVTAKASLLGAIGRANDVQVVYNRAGGASLIGFDADIEIVEMLFSSLLIQATGAMLRVPRDEIGSQVKAFRHAFLLAFAHRIGQRLTAARAAVAATSSATNGASLVPLFAARRDAIDAMVKDEFPYLRRVNHSISHYGGYGAGRAAADRADIGKSGRLGGSDRALTR